ncbi:MAG TPA: RecX family transcriptional regulator [Rhizorhapis sp.]|nr:RecX family transcriptional regulator [Rhizorhapis sp.]
MAMQQRRKDRRPLTAAKLEEMALNYVGRFATSRAKLVAYLTRKVRERGWEGSGSPGVEDVADRFVRQGYIDDRAFALSKARSLTGRGYGERRVSQALAMAGIGDDDGMEARDLAGEEAVASALRFARRRAIGPYAKGPVDQAQRERALAAMIRAGHRFPIARAIVDLKPGERPDAEVLINLH